MMYFVQISGDPYGGLNKQRWEGMTKEQAEFLVDKYVDEGWAGVTMGAMGNESIQLA